MLRFAVLAVLVAVATANPFLIPQQTRLIEGIVSCGSAGKLLDLTLTDSADSSSCTKVPCSITVGHSYNLKVDFIPSAGHETMNVVASVKFHEDGHVSELVNTNLPVKVEAGKPYSVQYPWTVQGNLGSGDVTLHIEVGNDGVKELCGEADGNIHA